MFAAVTQTAQVNGLRRELPLLSGSGASVHAVTSMVATALVAGTIGPLLILTATLAWPAPPLAIATAAALVGQTVLQVANAALVGRLRFAEAATQNVVGVIALVGLSALLVPSAGVQGYAWALAVSGMVAALVPPPELRRGSGGASLATAGYLARSGWWPMLVGVVFWLPTALDRPLVLALLGAEALGLYTLALQVGTAMIWVRSGVAEQWYPRIAMAVAAGDLDRAVAQGRRQLVVSFAASGAALLLGVIIGWPLVLLLLPEFRGGLAAALAIGLGMLAGAPSQVAANLYHAARASRRYLGWQVLAAVVAFGAMCGAGLWLRTLWCIPAAAGLATGIAGWLMLADARRWVVGVPP
jgi:O-antigen/teichoic acid export membrane protein